jgi:hypothetical protein
MLEKQEGIGDLARLPAASDSGLQIDPGGVGNASQLGDPELGGHAVEGYSASVRTEERFWASRLRWRLRGAWMWPVFVLATLVDGFVLHKLPPLRFGFSEVGLTFVAGILIATFGNLILIGAIAPWLARRLVRRRQEAPGPPVSPEALREVTTDRIGTALLVLGFFGVLASGLASIPLINGETNDRNRAADALVAYVEAHAPGEIRRNQDRGAVETARLADGYFRSCIPYDDRKRSYCVFINVHKHPTEVKKDPSVESNAQYRNY